LLIHSSYRHYGGEDKLFFQERDALRARLGADAVFEYRISTAALSAPRILWEALFPGKHYRNILGLIREHNIQLVHIHNSFPLLLGGAFRATKDAGAKVVHTLHNYRWWCINAELYRPAVGICEKCVTTRNAWHGVQHACYRRSRLQSFFAVALMKFYRKQSFSLVDHFIVYSAFQEQWVREQGIPQQKITYKPNWVHAAPGTTIEQRSGFVFVGRLEASKGIDILLAAWQQMPADAILTVIGTGSLETELRAQNAKDSRIQFLGACSQQETLKHIGRSKFLIQPSIWYETFGLTILEAMAQGVPVIGFDIGTRKDLIRDGENGFLCIPETLASTLQKALNTNYYETLSMNALAAAQQYQEELILERQINLYREWINQHQQS
ncbi:MAG: glycosyltransferase, partial [Bacteroidetes bacterium]|nr:glycosyltransferase [Bacteroidota bacterium]